MEGLADQEGVQLFKLIEVNSDPINEEFIEKTWGRRTRQSMIVQWMSMPNRLANAMKIGLRNMLTTASSTKAAMRMITSLSKSAPPFAYTI